MKKGKAILSLALAFVMLLSLFSCAKEEKSKEESKKETVTAEESKDKKDEEALKSFIADYRGGKYDEKKLFQYEDLSTYLSLGAYKGLTYPDDDMIRAEVTDKDVDAYLTQVVLAAKVSDDQYAEITEGVIQEFDMLTIDYRGMIDGVENENATAEGEELLVGSGTYIPGFETGLIGKKVGDTVRLDLRFSPYYRDGEVAGKPVTFYVTVKKMMRPAIPEISVELINEIYGTSFKTMEELREDLREDLEENKKSYAYSYLTSYLQNRMMEGSTVLSYPEKEMNTYTAHFLNYHAQYMKEGQTVEEYCRDDLNISYEEFQKEMESYAQTEVKSCLALLSVAKLEGITCSDEQLAAYIEGLYANQGSYFADLSSFLTYYTDTYGVDYFELQVIRALVFDVLHANAVKEG